MAKQLNVNLAFTADTKQVKTQLQDLQKQLTNLINKPTAMGSLGITKEIEQASVAAASLKSQLEAATNVNTGKLDLGKFNQSLKQSGYQIKDYKDALLSLGPEGAKAFSTLAQSITTAEVPLRRSSAFLTDFATTLKNTARWQISSSILHGSMELIQHAYGYAEDLNESLNNIRIVTGQSVDQMAKFASEANKAAQALSTTTTEYANASLIYYQQGLSDSEVKERTDVTVKMANVARESAEDVSQQMTAVWNNFDDGSKSLEYYADVMTALGAATASSTDEIAEGLEKFAAVSETVGLSYEYATSALATVTATTRQSADIVGNAFKTLFARIEGLSLGETLEDGTDLNKYSQALAAVGVNIKDTNGDMKEMDQILDELGAKWQTLSKDEQVALAQTVAGVRQYTQLIALMDNWDFFQENLGVANSASGTLQEQAEIYAESWEAARDRVKAASEEIYGELLNDEFFIDLNDGFAKALNGISDFIDGMGGLRGVLLGLGSVVLTVFKNQIAGGLQNIQYSLMMTTEKGRESLQKIREQTNAELKTMFADEATPTGDMAGEAYATQARAQEELLANAKGMTKEQQKIAQILMDQHNTLVQNAVAQKEIAEAAEVQANVEVHRAKSKAGISGNSEAEKNIADFSKLTKQAATFETTVERAFGRFSNDTDELSKQAPQLQRQIQSINAAIKDSATMQELFGNTGEEAFRTFEIAVNEANGDGEKLDQALQELYSTFEVLQNEAGDVKTELSALSNEDNEVSATIDKVEQSAKEAGIQLGNMAGKTADAESSASTFGDRLKQIPSATDKVGRGLVGLGQIISNTAMLISSVKGLFDTWNNEDMSFGDRLIATFTTLGFIIPMVVTSFQGLNVAEMASVTASIAAALGFTGVESAALVAAEGTASFGTVLYTVLWPIGLVMVAIAALVGTIWLLVQAFKAIEAASPEGQLKAAEEKAEELSTALDEATQRAEALSSAFDGYNSALDTLENCTRGTDEWKDALAEVNDQVLDILNKYPELAKIDGVLNKDSSGLLTLDPDIMEEQLAKMESTVTTAQMASLLGQQDVREKQFDVQSSIFSNDMFNEDLNGGMGFRDEMGIARDSELYDEIAKQSSELLHLSDEDFKKKIDKIAEDLGIVTTDVGEQFLDYRDKIAELGQTTTELNTAMDNLNTIAANEALADSGYSDTVVQMAANTFDDLVADAEQKLVDEHWGTEGIAIWDGANEQAKKIFDEYAKAAGLQGAKVTDTTGTDTNRKFVYEDAEGEHTVSLEMMRTTVATSRALEELGNSAEQAQQTLATISDLDEAQGLEGFIASGNFNDMASSEMDALKDSVNGNVEKYLKTAFQTDDLSALARQLGYETSEELVSAFSEAMDNYDGAINDIKNQMYLSTKAVFEDFEEAGMFKDLSVNMQESIANILDDAFVNGGFEGLTKAKDIISNLNADELDEFVTATQDIDWNTATVTDFKEALSEAGVTTQLTDEELAQFISVMKESPSVIADATTKFAELHAVIDELANGATVTAEEYEALGGNMYESFFLKMADGTYKLTTDAQTFYDIVNKDSIDNFRQNINTIKDLQNSSYSQEELSKSAMIDDTGYDPDKVREQLEFLEAIDYSSEQIATWRDTFAKALPTAEMIDEIGEAVANNSDQWASLGAVLENNYEQLASTASDLDELHQMLDSDEISITAFTKAALAMDSALDTQNLDSEELENYADYLQDAADNMEGFNDEMNADEARIVAKGIMKMNDAIDELADNWEKWSSILENSSEGSEEYAEAMTGMQDSVAALLDVSSEYVSSDFILEHLEDISKAAEGDAETIDVLKAALADEVIARIILDNSEFISDVDKVQTLYNSLVSSIPDIDVGVTLDGKDEFIKALDKLISATGMTVDQVNALCDSLGFEVNYGNTEVPTTYQIPLTTTQHTRNITNWDKNGNPTEWQDTEEIVDSKLVPFTGEYTAFAIATNGTAPKITGATKKATGSSNSYSSSNSGGTKSSGGSSNSGGSSEAKEPDHKDHADDVIDRYYDINNAISVVNQQLERNEQLQKKLDSMQSHYAGKTLIKSLQQENELLEQKNDALNLQYANYQKLYNIQSKELKELKKTIGGEWDGNELQNYSQLFQENLDRYNKAVDAYNAMSAEQQEASGKQMIEDAKTAYDEYKEALERYQDLYYNEMVDTENELAELRQQQLENQLKIIENNLEAWETDIQLKLDTTEAERNLNDFFKEVEQDFRKIFEDLTLDSAFDTKNFNTFLEDAETRMSQIKDVMAEIDVMKAFKDADGGVQLSEDMRFGSISEAQEYLKELQNELVDVGNSLGDMYEQVWDNYINGLDQAADNFEDINDELEHLTNELEYEKELIELIYGDEAYDLMNKYYETQQKNINEQIESTRTQAEFWENQFKEAYNINKDKHNVDLNDMSTWTEDMKKAYDKMISSQEKLNDLVLEGIQNLRDEYLNNVAKTLSDMDNAVWGMSFDDLKEDWDFIQKRADKYLDDVEGAYQIQTLANKIDTSIAETSSLKAQQKLAALREEEIGYLREKENLTQDDIDLAEARYQIALKEIALEDAQNNKTSMKLNRDESGNWTYQYVADEEDTSAKQQELLDAYNNLYETADNAYQHAMELAMDTYEEYREKLEEIANDTTLKDEEKYIKMQELRDMYLPEMTAAMENANIYEQETIYATGAVFAEVCEQDADAYYTLTDLQKALVDEVKDQNLSDYEEIRNAISNNYDEIEIKAKETFNETNENSKTSAAAVIDQWDGQKGSVKTSFQDAFDNIIKYTQNFEKELGVLEQVSNKEITSSNGVVDDFNKLGNKIDKVGDKTQDMTTTAEENLNKLRGFVTSVEQAWQQVVNRIREAINVLQEYIATASGTTFATSGISGGGGNSSSNAGSSSSGSGSVGVGSSNSGGGNTGSGSSNGGNSQSGVSIPTIEGIAGNIWIYGEWGDDPTRHALFKEKFGNAKGEAVYNAVQALFNSGYGYVNEPHHDWDYYKKFGPSAYKTGGYTGEWDSSGKLAILHEKELVLNADDTENMLNAVRTVRDIAGLNDSISETIASSIGQLVLSAMATTPGNYNTTSSKNTNNVFNITAEFPNADDVQTIRDAILSLPNIASQVIHEN